MVVTSKPITKYCCSDTTQTEARVIAYFSILTTIFCLLVLFITYSQVQSEFFYPTLAKAEILAEIQKNENQNTSKNESDCYTVSGRLHLEDNHTADGAEIVESNRTAPNTTYENNRTVPTTSENIRTDSTTSENNLTAPTWTTITKTFINDTGNYTWEVNLTSDSSDVIVSEVTRAPLDTELYALRVKERLEENATMDDWDIEKSLRLENVTLFEESQDNQPVICGNGDGKHAPPRNGVRQEPRQPTRKRHERGHLDLMAEFLLWDADTQIQWILPPFVWNILDLIRGLLLLLALRKRNAALAKLWWHLTALMCFAAIILFVPIVLALSNGEFLTIFILMFILVLSYNFYGMWIVNTLVADITAVATESEYYNRAFESDKVMQVEVIPVVEKFRVSFQPGT